MMQAVETKQSIDGGKVWFIDEIGDKTSIDKGHLLSSVIWNLVPVYSAMIEDLKADKFGTHAYAIQLSDDSVRLLHSKYIPDRPGPRSRRCASRSSTASSRSSRSSMPSRFAPDDLGGDAPK